MALSIWSPLPMSHRSTGLGCRNLNGPETKRKFMVIVQCVLKLIFDTELYLIVRLSYFIYTENKSKNRIKSLFFINIKRNMYFTYNINIYLYVCVI